MAVATRLRFCQGSATLATELRIATRFGFLQKMEGPLNLTKKQQGSWYEVCLLPLSPATRDSLLPTPYFLLPTATSPYCLLPIFKTKTAKKHLLFDRFVD
jgi:hypothetical protein